jgi:hypothetical protein
MLQVVRGDATPEEIAALVAVLTRRGSVEATAPLPRSLWSRPVLRTALHPGPGAWRASSLPR